MRCIFTIDVEEWFHILGTPHTPERNQWDQLEGRVERNFRRMLDLLDEYQVKATCFFLGWVAEKFPHLVREAVARGHEIASHGFDHRLVTSMTRDEFSSDVHRAKKLLEEISGVPVAGYRAPGFSATQATPWFLDILVEAGYRYDASVFPARRDFGGMTTAPLMPHRRNIGSGSINVVPMTVASVWGVRLCVFGGGYLRITPYPIIRRLAMQVLAENRPAIFYVHPREIDPDHPRLKMNPRRRFRSYVNLASTEPKIRRLFQEFEWMTIDAYLKQNRLPEMS